MKCLETLTFSGRPFQFSTSRPAVRSSSATAGFSAAMRVALGPGLVLPYSA